ncbi:MAG: sodium:solute symporter, partial [Planctomycetes bacterium]|nr:sodium:solute symporter [Planctomycetota bacterium]
GSDQTVVQRYMSTATEAKAARAILSNGVLSFAASVLFFGVGTALWAFYRAHPERLDPAFGNDQIFPLFIARELPVGIAGLVVAGVLAAAQSTISTSMNSVSTVLVTDWYRRFVPDRGDGHYLTAGRVLTVALGIIGTGTALVFASSLNRSLLDDYLAYVGLLTSILGGLFLLGILSRRAHAGGALAGAAAGAVALFAVKGSGVHFFLFVGIGMLTTLVAGTLASLVIPGTPRTKGLTVWT